MERLDVFGTDARGRPAVLRSNEPHLVQRPPLRLPLLAIERHECNGIAAQGHVEHVLFVERMVQAERVSSSQKFKSAEDRQKNNLVDRYGAPLSIPASATVRCERCNRGSVGEQRNHLRDRPSGRLRAYCDRHAGGFDGGYHSFEITDADIHQAQVGVEPHHRIVIFNLMAAVAQITDQRGLAVENAAPAEIGGCWSQRPRPRKKFTCADVRPKSQTSRRWPGSRSAKDCRQTSSELKNCELQPVTNKIFILQYTFRIQSNDGLDRRMCLIPARRFLPSMRRSRDALVGSVGRRLQRRHRRAADEIDQAVERVLPVARLGAVALRDDDQHAVAGQPRAGEPLEPRRARRRAATANRRTSKRSCTAVESLLTFWPPGPEARTKFSSISRSSILIWAVTRIMAATYRPLIAAKAEIQS